MTREGGGRWCERAWDASPPHMGGVGNFAYSDAVVGSDNLVSFLFFFCIVV